jgi:hypothetical protein
MGHDHVTSFSRRASFEEASKTSKSILGFRLISNRFQGPVQESWIFLSNKILNDLPRPLHARIKNQGLEGFESMVFEIIIPMTDQ